MMAIRFIREAIFPIKRSECLVNTLTPAAQTYACQKTLC